MISKLLNEIFPVTCIICGKIYKKYICPKCYYFLKKDLKFGIINHNNFKLFYICFYETEIRKIILNFKFNESAYMYNLFIEILNKNQNFLNKIKEYDYIIPVPMHIKNKKIRGYNQTELLAKGIEENFGITVLNNVLIKQKTNKRQSELTQKERIENVKNVYALKNEENIKNKKILILDDIYTTGNTIQECRRILKKGKPKTVDAFVIAKRN